MLTARILSHHRRCHKTAATPHVYNHTPIPSLTNRLDILFHHRCGLCAGAQEHPEDIHIHEVLEFGDGGALDGGRVADANLCGEMGKDTSQMVTIAIIWPLLGEVG